MYKIKPAVLEAFSLRPSFLTSVLLIHYDFPCLKMNIFLSRSNARGEQTANDIPKLDKTTRIAKDTCRHTA